jgi:hypothetical protein
MPGWPTTTASEIGSDMQLRAVNCFLAGKPFTTAQQHIPARSVSRHWRGTNAKIWYRDVQYPTSAFPSSASTVEVMTTRFCQVAYERQNLSHRQHSAHLSAQVPASSTCPAKASVNCHEEARRPVKRGLPVLLRKWTPSGAEGDFSTRFAVRCGISLRTPFAWRAISAHR